MSMYQDCDRCGDEGVVYTDEDGDDIVPCPECELGEQAMDNPAALWALEVAFWANRDHECIPDLPEEGIADFADQLWEFVQYPGEVTEAAVLRVEGRGGRAVVSEPVEGLREAFLAPLRDF